MLMAQRNPLKFPNAINAIADTKYKCFSQFNNSWYFQSISKFKQIQLWWFWKKGRKSSTFFVSVFRMLNRSRGNFPHCVVISIPIFFPLSSSKRKICVICQSEHCAMAWKSDIQTECLSFLYLSLSLCVCVYLSNVECAFCLYLIPYPNSTITEKNYRNKAKRHTEKENDWERERGRRWNVHFDSFLRNISSVCMCVYFCLFATSMFALLFNSGGW